MTHLAKAMVVGAAKTVWDFHLPILKYGIGEAKSKWITPKLKLHTGTNKYSNFMIVRFMRKHLPVWKRAIHAPNEKLLLPPKTHGQKTVRYVIQKHDAKRAGTHYDIRFMIEGRGVSFAVPKARMPISNENILAILQPDHIEEYFDFEGIIPDGYMGAGPVSIVGSGEADILQCDSDKIVFEIPYGPMSGRFVLISTGKENWIFRSFPPTVVQATKPNIRLYGTRKEPYLDKAARATGKDMFYEEKIDGACAGFVFDKEGRVELSSVRISKKTDKPIRYTHKCPELVRDLSLSNVKNMSGEGEIWHPRGPNFVAAILNSNPERAREMQVKHGSLRFAPFALNSDINYSQARQELGKLASSSNIRLPIGKLCEVKSEGVAFATFTRLDSSTPRDGCVIKSLNGNADGPGHKIKPTDTQDLHIIAFSEGNAKYQGQLGSLIVNHDNKEISIGSGFTDYERKWIWNNRKVLQGEVVQVRFHDRTNTDLVSTGGSFEGFHPSKSEAGLIMYSEILAEAEHEDPQIMRYKIKSAAGWHK